MLRLSWAVAKIVAYISSSDQICALQISAGDSGGLSKKKCRKTIKHSGGRGGWRGVYCTFYRVTLRSLGNIPIGLGDAEGGFADTCACKVLSIPPRVRLGWKGHRR